ncbi:MAG: hypothetical protein FRX49_12741 [Trebouxia sp. A1-2]|nr:MAG: hypothetical protein FRX49_12741 [Trebouxia sp. A1-2]
MNLNNARESLTSSVTDPNRYGMSRTGELLDYCQHVQVLDSNATTIAAPLPVDSSTAAVRYPLMAGVALKCTDSCVRAEQMSWAPGCGSVLQAGRDPNLFNLPFSFSHAFPC